MYYTASRKEHSPRSPQSAHMLPNGLKFKHHHAPIVGLRPEIEVAEDATFKINLRFVERWNYVISSALHISIATL